jgi:hypothetical protein
MKKRAVTRMVSVGFSRLVGLAGLVGFVRVQG